MVNVGDLSINQSNETVIVCVYFFNICKCFEKVKLGGYLRLIFLVRVVLDYEETQILNFVVVYICKTKMFAKPLYPVHVGPGIVF